MPSLYPLQFEPIFRRYLWGGRRLGTNLSKAIGRNTCAESWELVDHRQDQSVVREGPLAGCSLRELVQTHRENLLGKNSSHKRFPLLFKFLDAQKDLSLQVHPNDSQAARLDPPDLGKTEAWVVLDAEPGAKLYVGLQPGVDREETEKAIAERTLQNLLFQFEPQIGDCLFIPAGIVHAIGAGLLIAEIQQASDTTYRLFDWNRVDAEGRSRDLHVDAGLAVTNFAHGPVRPQKPQPTSRPHVSRLVACDQFILNRWQLDSPKSIGGDHRFHLLAILEGQVELAADWPRKPLLRGDVVLLPASLAPIELRPNGQTTLLEMTLPE